MDGLLNPAREVWLSRKIPVFLVRFYDDLVPTRTSRPVAEHVYKPSGMYKYVKGKPTIFHYEYKMTRRIEQGGLNESHNMPDVQCKDAELSALAESSADYRVDEALERNR